VRYFAPQFMPKARIFGRFFARSWSVFDSFFDHFRSVFERFRPLSGSLLIEHRVKMAALGA